MTPPDAKEIQTDSLINLLEKAHRVVVELSKGKRQWIMSIPAEPERDSDLIIGRALRDAIEYIRAISTLHQQHEKELREAWNNGDKFGRSCCIRGSYTPTDESVDEAFTEYQKSQGEKR